MFVRFFLPRSFLEAGSDGLSVLSSFFGGRLLGFVVMGGMPGVCYLG